MTFRREDLSDTVTLYLGDCLEVLPTLAPGSVDAVVTDPPYGCGKAEWDVDFPTRWYSIVKGFGATVVIITGSEGVRDSVDMVGGDFVDIIAARNLNGMTRSKAGFGNWIAATIAVAPPRRGVTFFEFVVSGDMPEHPSPKPIDYMRKLVGRVSDNGDSVLDPFMGSGTTGVAAVKLGRRFIGIEKEPKYYDIARRRISEALAQPALFQVAA